MVRKVTNTTLPRVGVERRDLIEALDLRRMARSPDVERADAHEHVRLELLDLPPQPLHQPIDVVSPPGGAIREAAGRHRAVMAVGVGAGPHLEDHGIEPRVGRTIEQRGKFGPLSVRR